jgi:broad specificity phosphatase PhoE
MIRHGQASFGSENYDRLSPLGVVQAGIVAKHLLKIGLRFDAIYSGFMDRQQKTAAALVNLCREQHVLPLSELIKTKVFNEYDSTTVFEDQIRMMVKEDPSLSNDVKKMLSDKRVFQRLFQKAMTRWASGNHDSPGSPKWQAFRNRVQQGIRRVMKDQGAKKTIAIFTSGGPISVTVQMALGLSDDKAIEISWQIMNASIARFKYNSEGIALAGFNDITHLTLEGDDNLLTYR